MANSHYRLGFWAFSLWILISSDVGAAARGNKTPEAYWSETGLRFKHLPLLLSNRTCHSSETQFVGCMRALNAVAKHLKPRGASFVPLAVNTKPILRTEGPLALVEFPALADSVEEEPEPGTSPGFAELWKESRRALSEENAALGKIYRAGTPIDFDGIFRRLAPQATTPETESSVAAQALNNYFVFAVDPHRHIDPTQQVMDITRSRDETFIGIGVEIQSLRGVSAVVKPMEGGPALAAGVKARDILSRIDGIRVHGMSSEAVVDLLRGREGTGVTLEVLRGSETVALSMTRRKIVVQNLEASVVTTKNHKLGVLRLRDFLKDEGCERMKAEILRLSQQEVRGWILDLRGNGGGDIEQSVCIAGLFTGPKLITTVKELESEEEEPYISDEPAATTLPMITLIDAGSASGSEIVAGALQDYQRSWIAGDTSFGKATMQSGDAWIIPGVMLFETTHRFYQPSGRTNQIVGIEPDFPIDPVPHASSDERFAIREKDLFSNALPALGTPWKQPRPEAVARIQECAKNSGHAEAEYSQHLSDAIGPDYRLLVAQELLACALAGSPGVQD